MYILNYFAGSQQSYPDVKSLSQYLQQEHAISA